MSVDYYVEGFKPASEKWEKMRKVCETCKEAKIKVPREVCDFFGEECPDRAGVVEIPILLPQSQVCILRIILQLSNGTEEYCWNKEKS